MNGTIYEKKNGRYIPLNDSHALDGLSNGVWLVIVKDGSTSCRRKINPKLIELDGALHYLQEGLCKALIKASEMRPKSTPISKKEQKAWSAYKKAMGKDMPRYFEYASFSEIADAGCDYIKGVLDNNNMSVSKIKEKYETPKQKLSESSIMSLEI